MKLQVKKVLLVLSILGLVGCAYFNTFYNAQKRYNEALKKQKNSKSDKLPNDIKKGYEDAIRKSWKLIDFYGDSSKYADDALLLIGKSNYNLQQYFRAQRILNQFLLKYPESDLVPEARLWLAKTYVALGQDEEALKVLKSIFKKKVSRDVAAQAFYIRGDLYFKREEYKTALEQLEKCVKIAIDDEMEGNARFLIGDAFFNLDEYENAIYNYEKLQSLDVPVLKEYEARLQIVESLIKLKKYEEAEIKLKNMLRDIRFQNHFPEIETKLGNLYEIMGDPQFAMEQYYEIQRKYKKSDGARMAAFYIAQLYETVFANMDSAEYYYKIASGLRTNEEISKDSKERSQLLTEYLKLRNQLRKDKEDMYKIAKGDSLLEDSVEVEEDSSQVKKKNEFSDEGFFAEKDQSEVEDQFSLTSDQSQPTDSTQIDSLKNKKKQVKRVKKVAVSRTAEEVKSSYLKTSFKLGEFFLLKYQNYDSAAAAYSRFITNFEDSIRTPKAYYALYVIFHDFLNDSVRADSFKTLILSRYPESEFGLKLSGRLKTAVTPEKVQETDPDKELYHRAEDLFLSGAYKQAIKQFEQIAERDSGGVWGEKARYAIAHIYEHNLKDIPHALEAYQLLQKEYPHSKLAAIARNKTAAPPEEKKMEAATDQKEKAKKEPPLDELPAKKETPPKPEKNSEKKSIIIKNKKVDL